MDLQALVAQLPNLREEEERWRAESVRASRKADSIERIIRGIEGLGDGADGTEPVEQEALSEPETVHSDDGGPRGIAAVRRAMLEHPERVWKAREVHAVLEARQWLSSGAQHPLRGTEAAINRLIKRGELERLRPGRYKVTETMPEVLDDD